MAEQVAQIAGGHQVVGAAAAPQLAPGVISMVALIPISMVLGLNGELMALVMAIAGLMHAAYP